MGIYDTLNQCIGKTVLNVIERRYGVDVELIIYFDDNSHLTAEFRAEQDSWDSCKVEAEYDFFD